MRSDGERMDCLRAAKKERGDGSTKGAVGGRGRGGADGMALLEMSSDVLFKERTLDGGRRTPTTQWRPTWRKWHIQRKQPSQRRMSIA